MVKGIHHVSLKCHGGEELARVRELYADILGLSVKREWKDGIMFDAGNCLIEIFTNGEGIKETGAVRHFAFAVDDVDNMIGKVRAAGFEVFVEPKDICIPSAPPLPARMAFFYGALGEQIELFCEK